jgi:parallel beta-helix repeat protein
MRFITEWIMARRKDRRARLHFETLEPRLAFATLYVAPGGNDSNNGSAGTPWQTLQKAANSVSPGDTVVVRSGQYAGFDLRRDGTATGRITFDAEPGVLINARNSRTPDGINLEGADYVTIDGFTVIGMPRTGIRSVTNEGVILRNNRCDQNGRWGILTGFSKDVLIENNECSRSAEEHGIYVANSADNPIVRGNLLWSNRANGLHMNGDIEVGGGDGIISGALVENNIIYDNGRGGGSGINCDGVQSSRFQNNLLYNNHASGISLYRIDGGGGSTGNVVVNNTILQAADARWAINIADGSTDNTLLNNILYNAHSFRGSITVEADSLAGLVSDYNVVMNRLSTDAGGTRLTLAQWRAATGQDAHSIIATPAELFVDPAAGNYRLKPGSPAIDRGTSSQVPPRDIAGNARPSGAANDIGAYERPAAQIGTPGDDTIYFRTSSDNNSLVVYNSDPTTSAPILVWPLGSTQPLVIQTLGGNDRLTVQLAHGATGPTGGVQYSAGDGENVLVIESGSIAIDSSATGTLDTIVKSGACLTTSRLDQSFLTIEPGGRVTLRPDGGTSAVTSLDLAGAVPVEETQPVTRQITREAERIKGATRNRARLNSPDPELDDVFARWKTAGQLQFAISANVRDAVRWPIRHRRAGSVDRLLFNQIGQPRIITPA